MPGSNPTHPAAPLPDEQPGRPIDEPDDGPNPGDPGPEMPEPKTPDDPEQNDRIPPHAPAPRGV